MAKHNSVSAANLPEPAAHNLVEGRTMRRPPRNSSQAHGGVEPLDALTAATQKFQPLPTPLGKPPYHYNLETAVPGIGQRAKQQGKLVFHLVGDTGGVKNPDYQAHVAAAMKGDLTKSDGQVPEFFYHLGDVVYFNGEISEYYSQFYEPYNHYGPPVIAIPGNHDGDPKTTSQTSLDGWVRYFMSGTARINPESQDAPRVTLSLPNVYFTLEAPFVTIVGMYTNVPEHGSIDSVQQQWLTNELATAPEDKALIVAMHHPIYSFDDHHGGSARMADALQHAINDSRRVPNLVAAAHVHNYQRIERDLVKGSKTPFVVIGNGGYYHLHGLNMDTAAHEAHTAKPNPPGGHQTVTDPATGATFVTGNQTNHGYSTITIDAKAISGVVSLVEETKYPANPSFDTFTYPVQAIKLPDGVTVTL